MHELDKKVLDIKAKLASCGIDDTNLVYMPLIPITNYPKEFIITEEFGMKVARLVSAPNE